MKAFIIFLIIMLSLEAKPAVLVTAATGAIGQEVCEKLASEGKDLIVAGRNYIKINKLINDLKAKHKYIKIDKLIVDFSYPNKIRNIVFPNEPIEAIVLIGPRPIISKNIPNYEEWYKLFTETFITPLELIKHADSKLIDNANIVIVSGVTSVNYLPVYPNSNIARIIWNAEIKNLATYFSKRKIRINAISPGIILTKYNQERIAKTAIENNVSYNEQMSKETSSIPLKHFGELEDVSNLVSFLISPNAKHINGRNILLDGGESKDY